MTAPPDSAAPPRYRPPAASGRPAPAPSPVRPRAAAAPAGHGGYSEATHRNIAAFREGAKQRVVVSIAAGAAFAIPLLMGISHVPLWLFLTFLGWALSFDVLVRWATASPANWRQWFVPTLVCADATLLGLVIVAFGHQG